ALLTRRIMPGVKQVNRINGEVGDEKNPPRSVEAATKRGETAVFFLTDFLTALFSNHRPEHGEHQEDRQQQKGGVFGEKCKSQTQSGYNDVAPGGFAKEIKIGHEADKKTEGAGDIVCDEPAMGEKGRRENVEEQGQ